MIPLRRSTDVFIIGGGPAGLATAVAARNRGMTVIVADGGNPPIDKACGEGLSPEALAALCHLGVTMPRSSGTRYKGIRFLDGSRQITGNFPHEPGLGIRRTDLHQALIAKAELCGAQLLWATPVTAIAPEGVHLSNQLISARWIVGADGSGSRVRRWAGLDRARRRQQRYATRHHYRLAPWSQYVEAYWSGRSQAYVTPLGPQEICVVVMGDTVEHATFEHFLRSCPELRTRLAGAELSTRERGAVTVTHSLSSVHSRNTALVGDASGGVDALTGDGLRLAFVQAGALADALQQGDLGAYNLAHRELLRRPLLMSRLLLTLGRNESLRARAFRMLAARPGLFARTLTAHSGGAPWSELLSTGAQLGWRFLTAHS